MLLYLFLLSCSWQPAESEIKQSNKATNERPHDVVDERQTSRLKQRPIPSTRAVIRFNDLGTRRQQTQTRPDQFDAANITQPLHRSQAKGWLTPPPKHIASFETFPTKLNQEGLKITISVGAVQRGTGGSGFRPSRDDVQLQTNITVSCPLLPLDVPSLATDQLTWTSLPGKRTIELTKEMISFAEACPMVQIDFGHTAMYTRKKVAKRIDAATHTMALVLDEDRVLRRAAAQEFIAKRLWTTEGMSQTWPCSDLYLSPTNPGQTTAVRPWIGCSAD